VRRRLKNTARERVMRDVHLSRNPLAQRGLTDRGGLLVSAPLSSL